jgi:hypothetical protein
MMDIPTVVHKIQNIRQVILMGLEVDASEEAKIQAKRAFDDETEMLNDMARHYGQIQEVNNG